MKRNVIVAVVLLAVATAWAHQPSDCPAWYEGGTLFQAASDEWRDATDRDRLATASEWAYAFIKDMSPPVQTVDEVFSFATQLRNCLDTAVEGLSVEVSRMSDVAAMCAVMMKDTFQLILDALELGRSDLRLR